MDRTKLFYLFFALLILPGLALAQMERERVVTGGPVDETFWAPNLVGMSTVYQLEPKNLNVTIMHNFGLVTEDTFRDFFGLDAPPVVRLGIDYGVSERWSVGVGRSTTFEKVYDFRTKVALLQQSKSGSVPVSVGLKGDLGIRTNEDGSSFNERLNYLASAMIARKFSDRLSLQLTPMYAHFNRVGPGEENNHFAIGVGGEFELSRRFAIIAEYFPVIGDRTDGTKNAFALGLNIETGGHVFQLFFESTRWHTEQHIISRTETDFFGGDFRFGFNVNRLFWLGKKK